MTTQVVLLAGGRGTRLGALSESRPKPLVMVAGKPFIQYLVEEFRRFGFRDFLILAGHLGLQIQDFFMNRPISKVTVKVLIEPEPRGTGGALRWARDYLAETFLLANADSLFAITTWTWFGHRTLNDGSANWRCAGSRPSTATAWSKPRGRPRHRVPRARDRRQSATARLTLVGGNLDSVESHQLGGARDERRIVLGEPRGMRLAVDTDTEDHKNRHFFAHLTHESLLLGSALRPEFFTQVGVELECEFHILMSQPRNPKGGNLGFASLNIVEKWPRVANDALHTVLNELPEGDCVQSARKRLERLYEINHGDSQRLRPVVLSTEQLCHLAGQKDQRSLLACMLLKKHGIPPDPFGWRTPCRRSSERSRKACGLPTSIGDCSRFAVLGICQQDRARGAADLRPVQPDPPLSHRGRMFWSVLER